MSRYDEDFAVKKAIDASINSPCQSKRGVVIWSRNFGLISTGFNAPPEPCKCDGSDECKSNCSRTAIHAEQRALINVRDNLRKYENVEMLHIKTVDKRPVFSEKPSCLECSKLILASEIKWMWLLREEGLTRYTSEEFHKQTLINLGLSNDKIDESKMMVIPYTIEEPKELPKPKPSKTKKVLK